MSTDLHDNRLFCIFIPVQNYEYVRTCVCCEFDRFEKCINSRCYLLRSFVCAGIDRLYFHTYIYESIEIHPRFFLRGQHTPPTPHPRNSQTICPPDN